MIWQKLWRGALSVAAAAILPIVLMHPISWAADFVHLGLTVGLGIGELNDTSSQVDGRFEAHDWSVGLASGPNTFLLFDKTNEIAYPLNRHKDHVVSEDSVEMACAGRARLLVGHYYVCTFYL